MSRSLDYIPPRISVLLATDSPMAIIICRHTSKRTAIIGWDRTNDTFEVTQWLKGKLYPFRCDISPDGKHWVYFAMSEKNRMYTVVAKTPYLKALDFYTKNMCWNGGGLFLSNKKYWLNDDEYYHHKLEYKNSDLEAILFGDDREEPIQSEDPNIYFRRLQKEGWSDKGYTVVDKHNGFQTFSKRINDQYNLIKVFHAGLNYPIGKAPYYESYQLQNIKNGDNIIMENWEWADIDKNRILWAEKGSIMSGVVNKDGLDNVKELFDTKPLQFRLLTAPY